MILNAITINTDASYSVEHNVGGFAFWIICDAFKVTKAGIFKKHPTCPLRAELYAIGNAIALLLSQNDLPKARFLIINTDSLQAKYQLKEPTIDEARAVQKLYNDLIKRVGSKKNEIRHVVAHTDNEDARSYVNAWCDIEAKKMMWEAVGCNLN